MKKLMIAAAIVCAAACSQAASIDWSIDKVSPYGGDESANDYQVYYIDTSVCAKDSLDGTTLLALIESGDAVVDTYGGIWDGATNGSTDGYDKGDTASAYLVVLNNVDVDKATHYYVTDQVLSSTANDSGIFTDPASLDFDASSSSDSSKWTQVAPEPTSGLLLLIGVAGLALRRRRA